MTIAESRRLALFESVKTFLGEDTAQTLMDLIPPDPSAVATKSDLAVLGADLRTEITVLGADLRTEIASVRVEMAGLRSDLEAKISEQTRLMMITMLTTTVTIVLAIVLSS